jgi:SAM-dependent methyltransferase
MSTIDHYSRQYPWRSWEQIFAALPEIDGQRVLDMGCGVGDLAADLARRGARVTGIDANEAFIRFAQSRNIPDAEFRVGDLGSFDDAGLSVDGIWSSFTAAYFPNFQPVLGLWAKHLRQAGWIALTEMDGLLDHAPISEQTSEWLNRYAEDAFANSRYDFHMGRRLASELRAGGFTVTKEFTVPDQELCFAGPASESVLASWRTRWEQMALLRDFCGGEFDRIRDEFLTCLSSTEHVCATTVRCCIAHR